MKISENVYQQIMSQAADKMAELYDKIRNQDDELATLRAQVERLTRRLNWIRENPNDGVALRFALEASDKEIDDIKELVNTD